MIDNNLNRGKPDLNEKDTQYILSLKSEDITRDLLKELFVERAKTKARFYKNQRFFMPLNKFDKNNNKRIETTIGRYIFNIFMKSENNFFYNTVGYVNLTLTQDETENINKKLANALVMDKISPADYIEFLKKRNWLGYTSSNYFGSSFDIEMNVPLPKIKKELERLLIKYEKELEEEPIATSVKIEKILLDMAKKELDNVPGMRIFKSGTKGHFSNNYKLVSIFRGLITKGATENSEYYFSKANLSDGIPKEEMEYYANILIKGTAGRSLNTAKGGYIYKVGSSAYQTVRLDKKGSDCGTQKTLKILLTKKNLNFFLFSYIKEGSKLVLLTDENSSKYIGRYVNIRNPIYCKSEEYCNVCAGDLPYRMGIKNIGSLVASPGNALMQISMKSFHNQTISTIEVDLTDFIMKI